MIESTYQLLMKENKVLNDKVQDLHGDDLQFTIGRMKELEQLMFAEEAAVPRWYGGSTNYKNALTKKMQEEIEALRLCSKLILNSWWASWLPFGWMHEIAASYYAMKARRIYNIKKVADRLMKLNGKGQ